MERDVIRIHPRDNAAVALRTLAAGETVSVDGQAVCVQEEIPFGHKMALTDLADGAVVVKYGAPIGHTTQAVLPGAWLHSHNLKTNLEGLLDYQYAPVAPRQPELGTERTPSWATAGRTAGLGRATSCGSFPQSPA